MATACQDQLRVKGAVAKVAKNMKGRGDLPSREAGAANVFCDSVVDPELRDRAAMLDKLVNP